MIYFRYHMELSDWRNLQFCKSWTEIRECVNVSALSTYTINAVLAMDRVKKLYSISSWYIESRSPWKHPSYINIEGIAFSKFFALTYAVSNHCHVIVDQLDKPHCVDHSPAGHTQELESVNFGEFFGVNYQNIVRKSHCADMVLISTTISDFLEYRGDNS